MEVNNNKKIKNQQIMHMLMILFACVLVTVVAISLSKTLTAKGTYSASNCSCADSSYTYNASTGQCTKPITKTCTNSSCRSGLSCHATKWSCAYTQTASCSNNASGNGCASYTSSGYSCSMVSSGSTGANYSCSRTTYNTCYTSTCTNSYTSCSEIEWSCSGTLTAEPKCDTTKACYACGNSQGVTYYWDYASNRSQCVQVSKSESECTGSSSSETKRCYLCGNSSSGSYVWGSVSQYGNNSSCSAVNMTESECTGSGTDKKYTITFNRAEGNEVLYTCTTDNNGKVDSSCIAAVSGICGSWSSTACPIGSSGICSSQNNQQAYISSSGLSSYTFSGNESVYCLAGTSIHNNDNPSTPDNPTPSNPSNPSTPTETKSCYECNVGGNKEYTIATSATNAQSATKGTSCLAVADDKCASAPVRSCYECKVNGDNKYTFATTENEAANNTSGNSCKTVADSYCNTTPKTEEKTKEETLCYVCDKDNDKKYTFASSIEDAGNKTNGKNCSVSANKNCEVPETVINPQTGSTIAIISVWIIGVLSIGYAIWYFRKNVNK